MARDGGADRAWSRGRAEARAEADDTSTASKHYTGLKFGSKKHFYGRVAPEGILTLHIKIDLFTAAERPKRILVSKCTFTRHVKTVVSYNVLILYL